MYIQTQITDKMESRCLRYKTKFVAFKYFSLDEQISTTIAGGLDYKSIL